MKKPRFHDPLTDAEEAEIQRMIASDPDNPELTDEQLATMKPFAEAFPELAASIEREKATVSKRSSPAISLAPDVIEKFKATGPGWQDRVNDVLRAAVV